ncbi:hypothetical protein ABID16_004178 [Rhizobium aquaticum]|uniref:DUF945 domain-containing protein n=1 Tax=Rhizobium aquaticum TaxID=1549636 RepID=A0ABV2J507_9HYPH
MIEGTYTVLKGAEHALSAPQDWSSLRLNEEEQHILARSAHVMRFGDGDGEMKMPVRPEQLLTQRRSGDLGNDLWTTWNVVQENAIKGGIRAVTRDEFGRHRRMTSRPVTGIDQDIKLNKALWLLGAEMAKLKGAR